MMQDRWAPRDRIAISIAVFALAGIVRLLHVWSIVDAPFFPLRMGDAAEHHRFGLAAADGDWLGSGVFFHAPLYPYFLGLVYSVFGSDALLVRSLQALLGGLSCVFVSQAAGRLFTRREAIAAGVLLALYGPAIFYDTIFQDSVLDLFFASLALWAIVEVVRTRTPAALLAAGLALGALSLTRENGIILVVPLLGWLALTPALPLRRRIAGMAIMLAGIGIAIAPIAVRDATVTGRVASGDQFRLGLNLYIGNNPDADGYYRPVRGGRGNPRFEMQDAIAVAERGAGRDLSEAEVADYWLSQTLEYVRTQPLDWLALMARKTALVLNTAEPPDSEGPYVYMEHSPILAIAMRVLGFGTLLSLAVLGVFVTWPERRRLLVFHALPVIYLATVVAFLIFGRYRHPVAPYLVLLAAPAVVALPTLVRGWRQRRRVAALATAVAVLLIAHAPVGTPRDEFRAHTHANVGATLEEQGDVEGAAREYLEAIRTDPAGAQAHLFLGNLLRRSGRPDLAAPYLARAVENDPTAATARNDYGAALASLGRLTEARALFVQALALDPVLAPAHRNLAILSLRSGDTDTAIDMLEHALAADAHDAEARRLLITAHLVNGDAASAMEHVDSLALMILPHQASTLVLGTARQLVDGRSLETPRPDLAVLLLENAPAWVRRNAEYGNTLAAAHEGAARTP